MVNQTVMDPTSFSQWLPSSVWLLTFFKISIFVQLNEGIHTGLEQLAGEQIMSVYLFGW